MMLQTVLKLSTSSCPSASHRGTTGVEISRKTFFNTFYLFMAQVVSRSVSRSAMEMPPTCPYSARAVQHSPEQR